MDMVKSERDLQRDSRERPRRRARLVPERAKVVGLLFGDGRFGAHRLLEIAAVHIVTQQEHSLRSRVDIGKGHDHSDHRRDEGVAAHRKTDRRLHRELLLNFLAFGCAGILAHSLHSALTTPAIGQFPRYTVPIAP